MLLAFCVGTALCLLGAWVTAKGALRIIDALGIDLRAALLWLGLAEQPDLQPRSQRRRLGELLAES